MSSVVWDAPELAERYDRVSELQFNTGLALIDMMNIRNGRILDVGCGTGRLALYLSKMLGPSGSVIGIDPSPHRVEVAKHKLDGAGHKNVKFINGRGEDLSGFPDNTFDHIYYNFVIHWIEDKKAALEEAYRVLKPGGVIGLSTVDKDNHVEMMQIMNKVFADKRYSGHFNNGDELNKLLNRTELESLLTAAGFRDLVIDVVIEKHHYPSTKKLFEFIEASTSGNFLRHIPGDIRPGIMRDIEVELEKRMTPNGIELLSNIIFVVAAKAR